MTETCTRCGDDRPLAEVTAHGDRDDPDKVICPDCAEPGGRIVTDGGEIIADMAAPLREAADAAEGEDLDALNEALGRAEAVSSTVREQEDKADRTERPIAVLIERTGLDGDTGAEVLTAGEAKPIRTTPDEEIYIEGIQEVREAAARRGRTQELMEGL